ncbi:transcriptional regulator [Pedobacter sp. HMWF019]|uniref:LCP family protein n=1 Tax=Pedobacter sp. HMWF019 TaxID=2056856 RepID=UPI000D33492A|nr:LCP family protein [Pedobacter sp. HMWF019]PTS96740.1 transcriptional regulator [Pedobacter sp. HMWF019]
MKSYLNHLLFLLHFGFMLSYSAVAQDTTFIHKEVKPIIKGSLIKTPEALGISPKVQKAINEMTNPPINIALFGVDRRNTHDQSNSDVIIILSINQQKGQVKMSSIMRDTYVNIEGKGMDKINAAFALGGPQLAVKTINQNFEMDIKDYMNVDFYSAAKIVDALGGVMIDVKEAEVPYLNNYLDELVNIGTVSKAEHVSKAGLQRLNGNQAVAYTRIRYVGRGDYERTERQRSVMVALFNQIKNAGQNMFPVLASQVMPNLETSMNNMTMLGFASGILGAKNKAIEQARFPLDKQSTGKRINNIWYLTTDLKATAVSLHDFIYKDIKPLNKN